MDDSAFPAPAQNWRTWWKYGAGLALVAFFILLFQSLTVQIIAYNLTLVALPIALWIGINKHRPADAWAWRLLAIGVAMWVVASFVWGFFAVTSDDTTPFPSLADVFYLAYYPFVTIALVRLSGVRLRQRGVLLDALVMTVTAATVTWFTLLAEVVQGADISLIARITGAAYPVFDVLLLAATLLLLLVPGRLTPSTTLLATGTLVCIVADVISSRDLLLGTYATGNYIALGWLISFGCFALAAFHPSMATVSQSAREDDQPVPGWRLLMLAAAALTIPAILLQPNARDSFADSLVVVGATTLILLIILLRLIGLLRELQRNRHQYQTLLEQAPAAIYIDSLDEKPFFINNYAETVLGYPTAEWLADPAALWGRIIHPDDVDRVRQAKWPEGRPQRASYRIEYRMRAQDGRTVWVRDEARLIQDPVAGSSYWQGMALDVTAEKEAEEALRINQAQFQLLFAVNPLPMWVVSLESMCFLEVNQAAINQYGYSRDEFLTMSLPDIRPPEEVPKLLSYLASDRPDLHNAGVFTHRLKDGRIRNIEMTSHILTFAGQPSLLCVARDVTTQLELQEQLAHHAFHDQLTGLPNRTLFLDRLNQALARARREDRLVAVLYLNLDTFKLVNDTLGHESGDVLLNMVADRLQTCVRPGDTVARQGGDEFALVLDALGTPEDAEHIAESIADALRPPFHISGRDVYVTASIGIAVSDSDGAKAEDLLRRADIAMYAAKRPGGGRHALFDPRHMEDAWQLFRLQSDLRHAIENDQLTLVYQPLVNLHDLTISEVEALVRWVHPVRGTLLPGEFIPKAEESGLIILLGEWVLRQACRQLRTWHLNDPERAGWSVAVNISARQLGDPTFVDDVRRILRETGLDPAFLELELTESAAIADMDTTRVTLHALNRLGIRLAIDDFGAGYAGLGYLRDCKVDALKIDRSFVAGLGTSAEDAAMIRAVLDVAGSLGLDVTAEGIESQEQLEQLRTMGCTRGQGYIFSRPLPAEEVPTHLRRPKLIAV